MKKSREQFSLSYSSIGDSQLVKLKTTEQAL